MALTFDDFEIDLDASQIRRGGLRIDVEPQVFDVIAYLAQHPGRLVSKNELIEAVWHGRIISDSAISTRINDARRTLGDDGKEKSIIKTVHGRGFRFEPVITRTDHTRSNPARGASEEAIDVRYCIAPDGTKLAYAEVGRGAPVLKTGSFMTHLQIDWESVLFKHWTRSFAERYRYIRYDQRGNGLSDWDVKDFSFEVMVSDLEAIVDKLELDNLFLLGMSQGASVSMEFAHRHPEKVKGLILFGGYAAGFNHSPDDKHRGRRAALLELTRLSWGDDNPATRQAYAGLFMPDGTPEQLYEFASLQKRATTAHNAYQILSMFSNFDVRPILSEIAVPTLVMHCSEDAAVPIQASKEIAAAIPNSRFIMLEGRNHLIQPSDPGWRRFEIEIERFVSDLH